MDTSAKHKRVYTRVGSLRAEKYAHLEEHEAMRELEHTAAKLIQERYLHSDAIFRCFGPAIMCRKDGAPSNYGTVHFSEPNTKAQFLVISDTSSVPKLSKFVEKFWDIQKPEVIISVTGSAQDIQLNPILQHAFNKGLTAAAASAGTWIITGGTDTGVMKLVATALRQSGVQVPLIGVTPYGAVANRHLLDEVQGGSLAMPYEAPTPDQAPLNSYHSHFILVESQNQRRAAWGDEINMRVAFEAFYLERKSVPMVLLVVQGGPGTISTVRATAEQGSPIVVVAGSGGAATAIKYYCDQCDKLKAERAAGGVAGAFADDEWPQVMWPKTAGMMVPLGEKFEKPEVVMEIELSLREIYTRNGEAAGKLLTMYEVDSDGLLSHDEDLSNVILQAIVRLWVTGSDEHRDDDSPGTGLRRLSSSKEGSSPVPQRNGKASTSPPAARTNARQERRNDQRRNRAIQLAVQWNRPQVVASIFREMAGAAGAAGFTPAHQLALQYALELRRVSILELLLSYPGFSLASVNLCRLFLYEDPHRFLASDKTLQDLLIKNMKCIRTLPADEQYGIFQDTIGTWLKQKVSPDLAHVVLDAAGPEFSHMVMWALFFGEAELADLFWKECDDPARVALLGARQCQLMGEHALTAKTQVESLAAELEKRATDVIDSAESQEDAFRVLEFREGAEFREDAYSLLDLALKFQMKRFLAHAHCQALLDQWWRGAHKASNAAVHENVSMTTLLVQAVFPIANPHYRERAVELFKSSNGNVAPEKSRVVMDRSLRVARDAACHALAERKAEKTARPNSARRSGADSDLTAILKVQMDGLSARARGQGGTFDTAIAATADKLTGFYQIPSVVFVLRFFMHCLFLLFYTYILSLTDTSRLPDAYPPLTLTELLFMCWSVTIVLDDICNTLDEEQQSPPDALMIMRDVGMVACVAARLEAGTTHSPNAYMVYHTLLSFNIIFLAFALIEYRSYTRSIGVLYIMIKRMMSDLIIFMEVFVYIVIGFCLAFYGLYNAQDGVHGAAEVSGMESSASGSPDMSALGSYSDAGHAEDFRRQLLASDGDNHGASFGAYTSSHPVRQTVGDRASRFAAFALPIVNPTSAFMKPIWAVYGVFELEELASAPFGASALMWVYVLISSVILVNLLVAMFSDTYTKVLEQAEEEFRYQRYERMYTAQNVWAPSPPPFSFPSNAFKLLRLLGRYARGRCSKSRELRARGDVSAVGKEVKRRAPAEAKRLQQRYLKRSDLDQSKTVDAKTSALQGAVQEVVAKQEQQFILLTEQMKRLAEELKAQIKQSPAPTTTGPAAKPSAAKPEPATWVATKPPAEPIEMPEADMATVPPIAARSGSSGGSRKKISFLSSTLRTLSPRRSPRSS